jgi:hypothetical protein
LKDVKKKMQRRNQEISLLEEIRIGHPLGIMGKLSRKEIYEDL